jgi:hypothetical protein
MSHAAEQGRNGGSINRQIRDIETRLFTNRDDARARAAVVGGELRDKLGSPIALLVAGGVGFAIAEYTSRRKPEPTREAVDLDDRADGHEPETPILASVMDLLSLAGSIMALLPAQQPTEEPETGSAEDDNG